LVPELAERCCAEEEALVNVVENLEVHVHLRYIVVNEVWGANFVCSVGGIATLLDEVGCGSGDIQTWVRGC
jgi:hypothetical protein